MCLCVFSGTVTSCLFYAVSKCLVLCPPSLQPCSLLTLSCLRLQVSEAGSISLLNHTYFGVYQSWSCKHWRSSQSCPIKDGTGFWWLYVCNSLEKRDGCLKYIIWAFSSQLNHAYHVSQTRVVKILSTLHLFYSSSKTKSNKNGNSLPNSLSCILNFQKLYCERSFNCRGMFAMLLDVPLQSWDSHEKSKYHIYLQYQITFVLKKKNKLRGYKCASSLEMIFMCLLIAYVFIVCMSWYVYTKRCKMKTVWLMSKLLMSILLRLPNFNGIFWHNKC